MAIYMSGAVGSKRVHARGRAGSQTSNAFSTATHARVPNQETSSCSKTAEAGDKGGKHGRWRGRWRGRWHGKLWEIQEVKADLPG